MHFISRLPASLACAATLGLGAMPPAEAAAAPVPATGATPQGESPALRELLDMPVGADPAGEFHLSAALGRLGGDLAARGLRRYLLHAYLRQAAGEALAPPVPVRQAADEGTALTPVEQDPQAAERWRRALNRQLAIVWPTAPVALPIELEASQQHLHPLGPGLWSDRAANGQERGLVLWTVWRHQGSVPLAFGDFEAHFVDGRMHPIEFSCTLPRYAKAVPLAPGQEAAYLCRSTTALGPQHPAYAAMLRRLTGQDTVQLRIEPQDLKGQAAAQRVVDRLEALAQPKLDAFLAANADCQRQGNCPPGPAAAASAGQRGHLLPGVPEHLRRKALMAAQLIGVLFGYALGVRLLGRVRTALVFLALGWISTFKLLVDSGWRGELFFTSGSYLGSPAAAFIPIFAILAALLAPPIAVGLLAVAHELVFGDRKAFLQAAWRAVVSVFLDHLLGRRRQRTARARE